jgi:hypothetical protein
MNKVPEIPHTRSIERETVPRNRGKQGEVVQMTCKKRSNVSQK